MLVGGGPQEAETKCDGGEPVTCESHETHEQRHGFTIRADDAHSEESLADRRCVKRPRYGMVEEDEREPEGGSGNRKEACAQRECPESKEIHRERERLVRDNEGHGHDEVIDGERRKARHEPGLGSRGAPRARCAMMAWPRRIRRDFHRPLKGCRTAPKTRSTAVSARAVSSRTLLMIVPSRVVLCS